MNSETVYYHASNKSYKNGEVVSITQFEGETTFNHCRRTAKEQSINLLLDNYKPNNYPSRIRCIYLFDDLNACACYKQSENLAYLYKVIAKSNNITGGQPMCIINLFSKYPKNQDILAKEYWQPTQKWKFKEFLCEEMTVIGIVDKNHSNINVIAGQCLYDEDYCLANKLIDKK